MARIKLTIPQNNIFTAHIPLRITDINYGNHLGNDALVSLLHEARMQWLISHKYTELDIGGAALIMADLAVEYKAESFYGDNLDVTIYIGEITTVSFEIFYEIKTTRNSKYILVAKAKTGMVCYDYTNKKVTALPKKFVQILNSK